MQPSGFLGRGWSFPVQFDRSTLSLAMSEAEDNINQSIDVLLYTPLGSRSLAPQFGCNLGDFLFKRVDATTQEEIIQSVRSTLLQGEPRIQVLDVILTLSPEQGLVSINVTYQVRRTNARHNHVFPFSRLEGTNLMLEGG